MKSMDKGSHADETATNADSGDWHWAERIQQEESAEQVGSKKTVDQRERDDDP